MAVKAFYDLPAPAKLNLFLHITGRRADGYHLLQSVFVLIDWADTLHVERRDDGLLRRHDLGPALPADDLSLRAARALQQASGCTFGADISVLKNVPWGAGMGGGSSDAATVLLALNRLWNLNLPRARLLELATPLGADVPFFVGGDNAFVEGIGEKLTPIEWPPRRYAVVKPAESLGTAGIFSHPDLARDTEPATLAGSVAQLNAQHEDGKAFGRNDLQPVAQALCPPIAQVAHWLETRFGNSRMTGSGSAVFATVGAEGVSWSEGELPVGWNGRMCCSLAHHPLRGWAD
ncbi:4-(cytidine 5'-diphospho)-2-C-methyl-D-erythritol kinase [Scleromatobacter humisilvae]|uniref:4-diphosphocytidyl-2-C-methyl-D-erythritol kinase n=1 Tax=Scleromatobacter humisilvae TaxID=2897159 RepID=A0A9X2C1K7_9BURK|nr:4-(cytidine 5'-diphospho)-2-C-methyl-D-erythritol kinase [Scleromatobacter humisilvae]MCK9688923.1 4-(cytidine 5'-diphospho)-2-C-methyl-D-erythritol kinase [Scleromatobacter humisilvae]